jgi:lipopolysaccharide exporter
MNLRDRMMRGAGWTVLYRVLARSLGIISTLVLAHLLVPADFGIVAMATSLYSLLQLMTSFGLDIALLRDKETTDAHYNCVWTVNVLAGLLIGALMLALAVPAADFYRSPRAAAVIAWLAAAPVLTGFENVGIVNFRKDLRFDRDFHFMSVNRILRFAITLAFALTLRSYWALVIGILAGRASGVLFSYLMHPFRPRFSLRGVVDLMHLSKWLMLHNALSFMRSRSSNVVIGRVAGAGPLGLFSIAAEISDLPAEDLVGPINRAAVPAYMKLAHDLPALRREYLSLLSVVALVAIPVVTATALCAPFFVLLFLGQKWAPAAGLIEILAFYGITRVIQINAFAAYLAIGKPQYSVGITSIYVSILVVLLISLTPLYGLQGAAWSYVIASSVGLPVDFFFITRFLGVRPKGYASSLWRPLCSAALMYVAVRSLCPPAPGLTALSSGRSAYALVLYILVGAPTYILAELLFWQFAGRPSEAAEAIALRKARTLLSRVSSFAIG